MSDEEWVRTFRDYDKVRLVCGCGHFYYRHLYLKTPDYKAQKCFQGPKHSVDWNYCKCDSVYNFELDIDKIRMDNLSK